MGYFYIENIIMCCLSLDSNYFFIETICHRCSGQGHKKKREKISHQEREKVLGSAPCVRSQCPRNSTRSGCLRALCPIKHRTDYISERVVCRKCRSRKRPTIFLKPPKPIWLWADHEPLDQFVVVQWVRIAALHPIKRNTFADPCVH
jgi:hypothetical protein